jgi:hypothetical protein
LRSYPIRHLVLQMDLAFQNHDAFVKDASWFGSARQR